MDDSQGPTKSKEEQIFHAARKIADSDARLEYLDNACRDDAKLRERVDGLLNANHGQSAFLKSAVRDQSTADHIPVKQNGSEQIGPYKLLHLLGEGGMGSVYLAEQQHPVKRRVAVKLIKQGLNSQQFIARFEAERQALAMMDHPNIAKVLDAGCSEDGRNYFVMEYVKGIPITEFCDENRLSAEERLRLFINVCQAVQHAHQKGVIHRDLKPSNVMVAMYDDQPVPKVIDFGVAKATHQPLTEHTLCTVPGQIVGTWEYMSPEQAILNQLDVDTRTDIYSLGVVLYELLTGQTPLDLKSLKPEMLEERLRRIREQEPARPSNRVSSLGEAAYRNTEADSLSKKLRGDLDTIVMKALEKDRSNRYETANGLAAEVQRFLNDEPLSIRPPTTWQRIGRTYRKHRLVALSGSAVVAALAIGLVVAIVAISQLKVSEQKASDLLENYLNTLTASGLLYACSGNFVETDRIAGEIENVNDSLENTRQRARPDVLRGLARFWSGETNSSKQLLENATDENPDSIAAKAVLAVTYSFGNEFDEYLELGDEVIAYSDDPGLDDFDRLYIGSVLVLRDSAAAVKELESVVSRKPNWAVARGTFADALAHSARAYGDREAAIKAIDEIDRAQQMAPDVPYLHMIDAFVHIVALSLTERNSREYKAWIDETRQSIGYLKKYPDYDIARVVENWFYLNFSEDPKEKEESSKLLLKTNIYPWSATAYLMQHNKDQAYSLLRDGPKEAPYAATCLAMTGLYNDEANRKQVIDTMTKRLGRNDLQMASRVDVLEILALAGDQKLAEKAERLQQSIELRDVECFPTASVVHLCCEDLESFNDFDQFMTNEKRQGKYRDSYLCYVGGLLLLGKGNQSDALRCFELCVEQNQINCSAFYYSRAFINRINVDKSRDGD